MKQQLTRRETLRLLMLGLGGTQCIPGLAQALGRQGARVRETDPERVPRIERIGVQLYTVRRSLANGIESVFGELEKAGITELEFAGYYDRPASFWVALMRSHGMTAPSTHIGLPASDDAWAQHFEYATQMGHKWVVVPSVPAAYRGQDGWKRLADRLNSSGELARKAGLRIGYHNHDGEFARTASGEDGLDILLGNTDPALVDFELDIYWAVKGGKDPVALLRQHQARFTCCHVKDAGPPPESAMMDVGAGTIDFQAVLDQGRKGALKHWFIEHDNPVDPLASVRTSAQAMKKLR